MRMSRFREIKYLSKAHTLGENLNPVHHVQRSDFIHWTLWLPDATECLAHCLALAETMSHSPCYHLLACAGQYPGIDTGGPFPGDPVWAWLSVTREVSRIILPLAHLLSLNLLFLSLSACMHTQLFSHIQLFATPWTVTHQALLSVDFPGKTAGVGCHFLLQGSFWFRDPTIISCIGRQILYHWATRNPLFLHPDQTVYKSAKCSPKLPSCYSLVVSLRRITAEVDPPPPGSRAPQREVSAAKSGALLQVPAASETWGI